MATTKQDAPQTNQLRTDFDEAIALLSDAIDTIERKLKKFPPSTGALAANQYHRLDIMNDALLEQRKRLQAIVDKFKYVTIPELYAKEKVKSQTIEVVGPDGKTEKRRITVSLLFRATIMEGMKDAAVKWLKKSKNTRHLVQETVNSSSLSSFAKSYVEEAGKDLPDDLFDVKTVPSTSNTKA